MKRRIWAALLLLPFIAQLALQFPLKIPCGFRSITTLPCPFCGMTHALAAIAKGELWKSLQIHPLALFGIFFLLALPSLRSQLRSPTRLMILLLLIAWTGALISKN